jgi:hypothetical protein
LGEAVQGLMAKECRLALGWKLTLQLVVTVTLLYEVHLSHRNRSIRQRTLEAKWNDLFSWQLF